jgi:hypothetical protein
MNCVSKVLRLAMWWEFMRSNVLAIAVVNGSAEISRRNRRRGGTETSATALRLTQALRTALIQASFPHPNVDARAIVPPTVKNSSFCAHTSRTNEEWLQI